MDSLYFILLLLGVVQGIAEFLPISSSGHLVIMENIPFIKASLESLGDGAILFINVALHVATLAGVVMFLWKDIVALVKGIVISILEKNPASPAMKTALYILAASLPAGIIGVLFNDFFETVFSTSLYTFICLILNGFILIATKKISIHNRRIDELGLPRSLIVGFFQAFAILPGISRSGMTIAGGLLNGMEPVQAARFSFLMAIPVIAGAGLLEGIKAAQGSFPSELYLPLAMAMAGAIAMSLVALKVLFYLVKRVRIDLFGYYTIAVGITGLIIYYL
jgi:undecaprenyl-diphosphatase